MKKRFLAILLSVGLTLSAFPTIAFADSSTTIEPTGTAWSENVVLKTDSLADDVTDDYVHVHSQPMDTSVTNYQDKDITLSADKNYRLSFMIRGMNRINDNDYTRKIYVYLSDSYSASAGTTLIGTTGTDENGVITVPEDEWMAVSYDFTGTDKHISIGLRGHSYGGYLRNTSPYDLRNFALYEIVDGEPVGNNLIEHLTNKNYSGSNPGWYNANRVDFYTESDYYRIPTPTDETVASAELGNIALKAGKYSVSAKFRINTIDYNLVSKNASGYLTETTYNVKLTAAGANGINVEDNELAMTTRWQSATFNLDVPVSTTSGELQFALDTAIGFDIADVEFTLIEAYGDYASTSGAVITETAASDVDEYLYVYDQSGYARIAYKDPSVTLDASKTYKVSVKLRTDYSSDANAAFGLSSSWGNSSVLRLGRIKVIDGVVKSAMYINDAWTEYSAEFTGKGGALSIELIEQTYTDLVPLHVADLSLVEVISDGVYGEELVKYGMTIGDEIGWSRLSDYGEVSFAVESDGAYYTVPATDEENNGFRYIADPTPMETGVYKISGEFRLADYKIANLEMNGNNITANNNVASISAVYDGEALETANGESAVSITNAWTEAEFIIPVSAALGVTKSDITFTLSDGSALDFRNITFAETEDSYTEAYVGADGNVIEETAVDYTDDYLYVYNVKSATAYPTYKDSDVTLDAEKTYNLSFKLRANASSDANATLGYSTWGSSSILRIAQVRVGGQRVQTGLTMTKNWKDFNIEFTGIAADSLEIKFTEQGYDELVPFSIAALSLVEVESGDELINYGTAINDTNGWSVTGQDGAASINAELKIANDTPYYSIAASEANTTFSSNGIEYLNAGTYYITGDFRLADYQIAKLDRTEKSTYDFVNADNNTATLTAANNGVALDAVNGDSTGATVTTNWAEAAFVLTVGEDEAVQKRDIVFTLSDGSALDFKNIAYTDVGSDYEAVSAVIAAIEAIGEVTLESEAAIIAAEEAYAALTAEQQALVTNYETLTTAREAYDALVAADEEQAAADKAAADAVIAAIDEIGEVTLESEAAIIAAEEAYAALTDAQKALVTNYETLTTARATYDELVEAEEKAEADAAAA